MSLFLVHNTTYHYQALYQILESLQVFAEKSLTEKNDHMYFIGVIEEKRQNEY